MIPMFGILFLSPSKETYLKSYAQCPRSHLKRRRRKLQLINVRQTLENVLQEWTLRCSVNYRRISRVNSSGTVSKRHNLIRLRVGAG